MSICHLEYNKGHGLSVGEGNKYKKRGTVGENQRTRRRMVCCELRKVKD